MDSSEIKITISPSDEMIGERIDKYLAVRCAHQFSRHRIKQLILSNQILVNGKNVKPNYQVSGSETVLIKIPPAITSELVPWEFPMDIHFEDKHLLVINKPAGIPVHPSPGHEKHTLVHALLYHCPQLSGIGGVERPGIVHRLDKKTSGLLMVAKTDHAHRELSKQLQTRSIRREYYALVIGNPKNSEGTIALPIGRHPINRKKMSTYSNKCRDAITTYKVLEYFDEISFLSISLASGRTHQIRVHFSAIHHPVLGDDTYSPRAVFQLKNKKLKTMVQNLTAYALHARLLGFNHPNSGEYMEFACDLPAYFTDILSYARNSLKD